MGLPWWLSGKESACNAGATGDTGLIPGSGKSPWGGCGNPLQYPYLENPMDRGAWWATVHRVSKSWTRLKWLRTGLGIGLCRWGSGVKNLPAKQETWILSLGLEDALEEEMATHSSILTWRIPWTEEPGRLRPWGCKESDATEWLSNNRASYASLCYIFVDPSLSLKNPHFCLKMGRSKKTTVNRYHHLSSTDPLVKGAIKCILYLYLSIYLSIYIYIYLSTLCIYLILYIYISPYTKGEDMLYISYMYIFKMILKGHRWPA